MYKYKYATLIILLFCIFSIGRVYAVFFDDSILFNKVIYIDPGHGGADPGAIYKDLRESDINLFFSKEIGKRLEKLGATIFYTREGDYDLASTKTRRKRSDLTNRIKLINDSQADLYISIHVNSEESTTWYGAQVFYSNSNKKNTIIAQNIQEKIQKNNISKRKIAKINNTYMYDRIKVPGVLLEIGFISNYSDRIKMQDEKYVEKFSDVIVDGIVNHFKINSY